MSGLAHHSIVYHEITIGRTRSTLNAFYTSLMVAPYCESSNLNCAGDNSICFYRPLVSTRRRNQKQCSPPKWRKCRVRRWSHRNRWRWNPTKEITLLLLVCTDHHQRTRRSKHPIPLTNDRLHQSYHHRQKGSTSHLSSRTCCCLSTLFFYCFYFLFRSSM